MALFPNPLILPIGLFIGILVAAPVGPVNVLCIQRSINCGFLAGLAAGVGATLGDGLIALFASLGVGQISTAVNYYRNGIQIVGGAALIVFGFLLYYARPSLTDRAAPQGASTSILDFVWDIPKAFFLTITNPGAVLGSIAIFGGVGAFVELRSSIDALTMVAAIMTGSLVWWVGLSYLVSRIRHRLSGAGLQRINRVAGALLIAFGAVLIAEVALKTVLPY